MSESESHDGDAPAGQENAPAPHGAEQPESVAGDAPPAPGQSAGDGAPATNAARSRRNAWLAAAVLCVAAGSVVSLIEAKSVAHSDTAKAARTFTRTAAGIDSTISDGIQHQDDLAIAGSTYLAGNPQSSRDEFTRWAHWARTLRRYPELESLAVLSLVRPSDQQAFVARRSDAARTTAAGTTAAATGAAAPLAVTPASKHDYHCLALVELTRTQAYALPAGFDFCATTHALLLARETGQSGYAAIASAGGGALSVLAPVYRGNVTPVSAQGRAAAFAGWLREVLLPEVLVREALTSHPGYALRLRYGHRSANILFSGGAAPANGQSLRSDLHEGWSVRIAGPALSSGVLADNSAVTVLLSGILLSVLLAMLVLMMGAGSAAAGEAPPATAAVAPPPPQPELPPVRTSATPHVPAPELYDPLTGLPNRALTLDRAGRMVARASRQSGMLAGALIVDIDWFKDVNEKLGESAGDKLLSIVAERLESVVRGQDTVGRMGSDEFVVLVESAARGVRLDNLARRMIESLHKPVGLEEFGPSFFLTASIGVAFGRYESAEDLLHDSQLALLAAKSAGKDRYTLFNANMRAVIEGRSVLEAELNAALLDGQFSLLYEPIYDLAAKKVVGVEALLRWQHPKQGVLEPDAFLALAEETGLIVPIGRWALEEACARAAAWDVGGNQLGVAVGVSANQLNRDGILTDVRRALQQSGVDPSLLTLQVSETAVMGDVGAASERLRQLREMGVKIAIDDFGSSGYAYHSDLRTLPLDCLKVDKSSLAAAEDEDYRSWLLEAILIVGRELSLTVVAKGIETYEQVSTLREMGCSMAQGTFMGPPAPAEAVEGLLTSRLAGPRLWSDAPHR